LIVYIFKWSVVIVKEEEEREENPTDPKAKRELRISTTKTKV
jgi:hypothetical protein